MNRKLFGSIASLYGAQLFGYLIPLVTLPYLTRCLGPVEWGRIALAEAYAANLSIIIEYGFGLSASREVARIKDDINSMSRYVSDVLSSQVLLLAGSIALTLLALRLMPSMAPHGVTLMLAVLIAAGRSLTPTWYFQGVENLRLVSLLNVGAGIVSGAAIFAFVHSPSDAWKVLTFRGISSCGIALVAIQITFKRLTPMKPSFLTCLRVIRGGLGIFFFKSAVSFYTTANVLLLGILASPVVVALFAGAEKISKVATGTTGPISQAFYPRIANLVSHDAPSASQALISSARLMICVALSVGVAIFLGAPMIVKLLLGRGFERSVPVLRVMSALPLIIAASNILGIQWMLPLRLDRDFNIIIVMAGAINIALAVILVPRSHELGMAISVVVAETFVSTAMLAVLWARGLHPWANSLAERKVAA